MAQVQQGRRGDQRGHLPGGQLRGRAVHAGQREISAHPPAHIRGRSVRHWKQRQHR